MATFPRREADVAALAGTIVNGLTEHGREFPDTPVTVETLQEALLRYRSAKETAETAEGAAAVAYDEKQDALQDLSDKMKSILRYAEIAHRDDEGKLRTIGWSGKREPTKLQPPGAPRT